MRDYVKFEWTGKNSATADTIIGEFSIRENPIDGKFMFTNVPDIVRTRTDIQFNRFYDNFHPISDAAQEMLTAVVDD